MKEELQENTHYSLTCGIAVWLPCITLPLFLKQFGRNEHQDWDARHTTLPCTAQLSLFPWLLAPPHTKMGLTLPEIPFGPAWHPKAKDSQQDSTMPTFFPKDITKRATDHIYQSINTYYALFRYHYRPKGRLSYPPKEICIRSENLYYWKTQQSHNFSANY